MKKFTILLLLIPFFGFSQTFDFSNSDDGWSVLSLFTAETNATYYTLSTVEGDGVKKNPNFGTETAGVNTEAVSWIGITIKNNDDNGPTFMRVSYPKPTSGRVYKNIDISAGNTEYETYWIDLSNATNWVGTINDFKIHFKAAGNTDYILPETPVTLDVDKIEFAASPTTTLQNTYMFDTDGDAEGFSPLNASMSGPSGGILTFTPVPDKYAKLEQLSHHVDASNKYVHITMKNNSALNNQLRLVSPGLDGTKTMEISVSDMTEKTYTFDLTGEAGWTGDQLFTIGIGSLEDGKAKDDGTVEFNAVIFDDAVGIADRDQLEFSMYPNPAKETLFITSPAAIASVTVVDITGKQVLKLDQISDNRINVSSLVSGIYMVRVEDENQHYATQKLFITR